MNYYVDELAEQTMKKKERKQEFQRVISSVLSKNAEFFLEF